MNKHVKPVPCAHIHMYYLLKWTAHKCIAWNLLQIGYKQWSMGHVEDCNNLYG